MKNTLNYLVFFDNLFIPLFLCLDRVEVCKSADDRVEVHYVI